MDTGALHDFFVVLQKFEKVTFISNLIVIEFEMDVTDFSIEIIFR